MRKRFDLFGEKMGDLCGKRFDLLVARNGRFCGVNRGALQPGLTGGSGDTYVRHMLVRASTNGWRVVVFNSRGCGDSPVTTPKVVFFPIFLIWPANWR